MQPLSSTHQASFSTEPMPKKHMFKSIVGSTFKNPKLEIKPPKKKKELSNSSQMIDKQRLKSILSLWVTITRDNSKFIRQWPGHLILNSFLPNKDSSSIKKGILSKARRLKEEPPQSLTSTKEWQGIVDLSQQQGQVISNLHQLSPRQKKNLKWNQKKSQ